MSQETYPRTEKQPCSPRREEVSPFTIVPQTPSFPHPSGPEDADRRRIAENEVRRLLYFLLGSTLFHGALLWVPFPMSSGGAGESIAEPLRVRLVAAARPEARPAAHTAPPGQIERLPATPRPESRTPPAAKKQSPAPEPERITVARAQPAETKEAAPAPATTPPVAKEPPRKTSNKPSRRLVPAAEPVAAADSRPAEAAAPAPEPRVGESTGAAADARLARGVAPGKSSAPEIEAAAALIPVRYARTNKPRYPGKARRAGWEGTTVLKVLVDSRGAPDRVTVDRTSGFEILDAAAVRAVGRWRFHPARRGGDSVASWVRIPVAFKLKEDKR